MRTRAIIMIVGADDARNTACRLTVPVPSACARPSSVAAFRSAAKPAVAEDAAAVPPTKGRHHARASRAHPGSGPRHHTAHVP